MERQRSRAKTREGVVVSSAMDKTVVVAVKRTVQHRRYHKYLTVSTKYLAHDERNECSVGDRVVIADRVRHILAAEGIRTRVVSMPCSNVFDRQPTAYQDSVLPLASGSICTVTVSAVL